MRYKRSVHRVAGGSVCGSCCVNICQNKLLHLSWEVLKGCGDWKALRQICADAMWLLWKWLPCMFTLSQFVWAQCILIYLARRTPGPKLQKWVQWAPIPCATRDLCTVLQGDLFVVPAVSIFARTSFCICLGSLGRVRWLDSFLSTMAPYTMRYKRSVHRFAGGSVCGSCRVNIGQNDLLHYLSWEVSEERGDCKVCGHWRHLMYGKWLMLANRQCPWNNFLQIRFAFSDTNQWHKLTNSGGWIRRKWWLRKGLDAEGSFD